MTVFYALLGTGALGALFGIILAVVSRKFAVAVDARVEQIVDILPGANCGACGYAGCAAFAEAAVAGTAEPNACIPGGEPVAREIAGILGREVNAAVPQVAVVVCQGFAGVSGDKAEWEGIRDCAAAAALADGPRACRFACIGFGTCAAACPFDAIDMVAGKPVVTKRCVGCGVCVAACPKHVLVLRPAARPVHIRCHTGDLAKESRAVCTRSCIKCKLCLKQCPVQAISWVDDLPRIDYEKCIDCGACARVCPRAAITDQHGPRRKVVITDDCIGCTLCVKKCPVAAISGERKQRHTIAADTCIGCYQCVAACPKQAITLTEETVGKRQ